MASLAGKVVVLNFFRASSIHSVRVERELRTVASRFPAEVVVVGIHSPKFPHEHDHHAVERSVEQLGITHPVLDDPDLTCWQQYGVKGWPTVVLIDPDGFIVGGVSGEGCGPVLISSIESLLLTHTASTEPVIGTWSITGASAGLGTLAFPSDVAVDASGRRIAIVDTGHDRILVTDTEGRVETVHPMLNAPRGVAFDGDRLIVCDTGADRVLAIDRASGTHTLISDQLGSPWGVAVGADGTIVATEAGRHRVWRLAPDTAELAAGDGQPAGVAARADGSVVYLEAEASTLRTTDGHTLVGQGVWDWGASDGDGTTAAMQYPLGVAARGDTVYVADTFNGLLRAWEGGVMRTLPCAGLSAPSGVDVLADGRLVVADTDNHRVVIVGPDDVEPVELVIDESWLGTRHGEPISAPARGTISVPYASTSPDTSPVSPVRVELSSEPPSLLAPGPRVWELDEVAGVVGLTAGTAGAGVLLVTVSIGHDSVRTRHDLTVTA